MAVTEETLMLKKMLVGLVIGAAALAGSAGTGHAGVSVDLGFHFGAPPAFEPVPSSPVMYAPSVGANLFSYGGEYFVFLGTTWYVGAGANGPWSELPPYYVPRPLLAVPVHYFHDRPREWAHWRRDAPPRWERSWGSRWEERYTDRHHSWVDEHRDVRHTVYRDAPRDDRRGAYGHPVYHDDHRDDHRDDRRPAYRDERR